MVSGLILRVTADSVTLRAGGRNETRGVDSGSFELAELWNQTKLLRGTDEAERGELSDGDEVFEELREMIEERRLAKAKAR